ILRYAPDDPNQTIGDRGMGLTERLARASAAKPRRTFALWGVAVVIALGLVATSLHGLSSESHVIGTPESTKAADAIARAFPRTAANTKQDVIVVSSRRDTATPPAPRAFGPRRAAALQAR